jgi:hypothetical protein
VTLTMPFRRPPVPEPNPDPEDDDPDANWVAAGLVGFGRFLRSAALDARLDRYLEQNPRPRHDEDAPLDDPALDKRGS